MVRNRVNGPIFLGAHNLHSGDDFVSIQGVPLSDMEINWAPQTYPDVSGLCLTMAVNGSSHYMNVTSCKDSLPYICSRKFEDRTMNECGTFDDAYHLNKRTGSCYKVHFDTKTWYHAYEICAAEGGHLVVINNKEEALFIKDMFPARPSDKIDRWEKFHIGMRAYGGDHRTWVDKWDAFFIGLFAYGDPLEWMTVNGDRVDDVYNYWDPGQPDNRGGIQRHGTIIRAGTLDDDNGGRQLMFVCEKSPTALLIRASTDMLTIYLVCLSYLLIAADSQLCKPQYLFSTEAEGWLKLHTYPASWEKALQICSYEGAVLTSPLDAGLVNAIRSTMAQNGVNGPIFLGTHNLHSGHHFVSVEGAPLSNMKINWALQTSPDVSGLCLTTTVNGPSQYMNVTSCKDSLPYICYRKLDNRTMNKCGTFDDGVPLSNMKINWALQTSPDVSGLCLTTTVNGPSQNMNVTSCKDSLPYICYRKFDNRTMNKCGTFDDAYHLNKQTGSCYKVHHKKATWHNAYEICAAEGGHLVVIDDEEEALVIENMFTAPSIGQDTFFIGLFAYGDPLDWMTVNGDRVDDVYNKWGPGQPDNRGGIQHYATINRDGTLDDDNGATKFRFVCEKSPTALQFEPSPVQWSEIRRNVKC
ncbi:hypothetical protein B5X24_HaOG213216 [Helicoverpa armigera]|uniref:C-type lectin domain-containing protein n=1 Tax=Helicoverpa armigera TaxID=29058 RepID=A0A2W1B7N9_HELAM|nr:hypothetical protein B5X24_HaOG213216 [Helicoverpa armigera]